MINARKSVETIALSSALTVLLEVPELETDEAAYVLFVFDRGVPVLVSCGRHTASGMILALEKEETESAETLQAVLKPYGIEVEPFGNP